MKRPCVWVCLSAIGGILLGVACKVDAISLGVIFTLMAAGWRMRPRRARQILVLGACSLLFFMRVSAEMDQRSVLAPMEMEGLGVVTARHAGGMEVEVISQGTWRGSHFRFWVEEPLLPGTKIRFSGSFLPLKRAGNPGGRDDLLEGAARDLWYESDRMRILETVTQEKGVRARLQQAIARDYPKELQGLVSALLLADRAELETVQLEAIRAVGISHLIAISGFHFVLLLYALRFLIRRLGASPWFSNAIGLLLLWGYGGVLGFPIAALRALVLMSFVVGGEITRLRVDRINLLFAAALALLWIEPFSLFSVGFQLSVSATLFLLILPSWIQGLFFSRTPVMGKVLSPVLAVQAGVLPLTIRSFREVSLLAVLGNLLLAPIFMFVMVALFVWAGLAILGVSQWFAPVPIFLLQCWMAMVSFAASHFLTTILLPKPSWEAVFGYYMTLGFFYELSLGRIRLPMPLARRLGLALVLVLVTGLMFPVPVRFWVLDVGQGDALLLSQGSRGVLWDAGGSPFSDWEVGRDRVEPALDALGIRVLDLGICTHFDADHAEGMVELVEDHRIDRIVMGFCNDGNALQTALLRSMGGDSCIRIDRDLAIQWGDSIEIRLFVPPMHQKENQNSILTRLKVGETVLWLTGDMEAVNEAEWVGRMELDGDILKIAHHGSNSSTTEAFLDAVDPDLALISVGKNSYGHPANLVLERLRDRDIGIYRTDQNGALEIRFTKQGYQVIPYRQGRQPFGRRVIDHGSLLAWLGLFLVLGVCMGVWRTEEKL